MKKKDSEEKKTNYWHLGFAGGLALSFRKYRDKITIESEYQLSMKSLEIDFLLLKKDAAVKIDNAIGWAFRGHNIIEYKSPDDELNIDVLWKTIGYAGIYKSLGKAVDEINADDITISIIRSTKPKKLLKRLLADGKAINTPFSGIYLIEGIIEIPLQIVVTDELDEPDFLALKIMKKNADENEIIEFIRKKQTLISQGDINCADAVINVSYKANKAVYKKIRGEITMNEWFKDLFKDDIDEARTKGEELKLISLVCKKMSKGKSIEEIAYDLDEEPEDVKRIYDIATAFAPAFDNELIYDKMQETAALEKELHSV